ncbi:hypothetical protein PRUB_a1297 [Pseudoalteromonas rubra]|uniref:Solute-binding protein family 3/N-terminal domain-containing protein n=1 Tax=Pseudoalteromonas rubra TaxID=43658 RepID=A0A8T0C7C8_9GAMM|nr:hypothetical protein [Pseudoalteromonas rubra]KAF7786664.1 hypothetical protein PRUB_a1297 [Pseudoalteromonas rubra]
MMTITQSVLLIIMMVLHSWIAFSASAQVQLLSDDPLDIEMVFSQQPLDISTDSNNLVLNYILKTAPSFFRPPLLLAPGTRIDQLLQSNLPFCALNRIKTRQRAKQYLFSLPVHLYPSHRLYFLPLNIELAPFLNEQGQLTDLIALLQAHPRTTLLTEAQRSYGDYLDTQLARVDKTQLIRRPGGDSYKATITMFERGRVSFILTYPTTIQRYASKLTLEQVHSIEIANNPPFVLGHIACSDTPETRQFLKVVNTALRHLYQTARFYELHLRYLPESERDYFKLQLEQQITKAQLNNQDMYPAR